MNHPKSVLRGWQNNLCGQRIPSRSEVRALPSNSKP